MKYLALVFTLFALSLSALAAGPNCAILKASLWRAKANNNYNAVVCAQNPSPSPIPSAQCKAAADQGVVQVLQIQQAMAQASPSPCPSSSQ